MAILSKEEVLAAADRVPEELEISEWGGSIMLRALTVSQRAALLETAKGEDGELDTERLTVFGFIAGVSEPKFSAADYDGLAERSAGAMDDVIKRIWSMSGIDTEDEKDVKEDFSEGANSGSSSTSRKGSRGRSRK